MDKMLAKLYGPFDRALRSSIRSVVPRHAVASIEQALLSQELDRLLAHEAGVTPYGIELRRFKVYSQGDEDGLIASIFHKIGEKSRLFIEFGCGDGLVNNTHYLALQGWRGVWVDGAPDNIRSIREVLGDGGDRLSIQHDFVTLDNINEIAERGLRQLGVSSFPAEIDFLSLDLDGNDLHFMKALSAVSPRVICVEYNGRFPPPISITIPYDAEHRWRQDDYVGASLSAFGDLLEGRGYRLVACSVTGANGFFVREGEIDAGQAVPIDRLFMPARHHLARIAGHHAPSLKFLRDVVTQPMQ